MLKKSERTINFHIQILNDIVKYLPIMPGFGVDVIKE